MKRRRKGIIDRDAGKRNTRYFNRIIRHSLMFLSGKHQFYCTGTKYRAAALHRDKLGNHDFTHSLLAETFFYMGIRTSRLNGALGH